MLIQTDPVFTTDVTVKLPGVETETFKATFAVMPISEFEKLDFSSSKQTADFLVATIRDVKEVEDEKRKAVPYSPELRAWLIDQPHIRGALFHAYVEGVTAANRGN
jgi:hypothetical protein